MIRDRRNALDLLPAEPCGDAIDGVRELLVLLQGAAEEIRLQRSRRRELVRGHVQLRRGRGQLDSFQLLAYETEESPGIALGRRQADVQPGGGNRAMSQ